MENIMNAMPIILVFAMIGAVLVSYNDYKSMKARSERVHKQYKTISRVKRNIKRGRL